jgi:hypothetical protein
VLYLLHDEEEMMEISVAGEHDRTIYTETDKLWALLGTLREWDI